ncbi:MAG: glutamine--fructose-6-phosphate transaminase (isomerizing), partial [Desulfurococcaceae archaeon]
NYLELKDQLQKLGHRMRSRTDSEVIAHLIEMHVKQGLPLDEAVRRTLLLLKGSYAIAAIFASDEDTIICARMESPLVIGLSPNFVCCSSDIPALPKEVEKIIVVENGEIVVIRPHTIIIKSLETGQELPLKVTLREEMTGDADIGGFTHYMLKEIHEQPQVALNVIKAPAKFVTQLAEKLVKAERVYLIGCGTSYHACIFGSHVLRFLAKIDSFPLIASEFDYCNASLDAKTVVLALSQSGETMDVLSALKRLQDLGIEVLALTNVMGSSITRLASAYLGLYAGPEIGVAATKTFTAQLLMLARVAVEASNIKGENVDYAKRIEEFLRQSPSAIKSSISSNVRRAQELSVKMSLKDHAFFLARGVNVATALEGALKLKEVSYVHAEGYPAGESKHGPIALVEEDYPCVFICPQDETYDKVIGNIMEMKARGAFIVSCIEEGDKEVKEISDFSFVLPSVEVKMLTPVLHVLPLQLLAYYTAVARGFDPDKPRNLAKSVTVP